MKKYKISNIKYQIPLGFSLVEIVLSTFIFAMVVTALASTLIYSLQGTAQIGVDSKAALLAEEAAEAVKSIAANGWNQLHYNQSAIVASSGTWILAGEGTIENIAGYQRQIVFSPICRDSDNNITACPGNYTDINSKRAQINITWTTADGKNKSFQTEIILSNWVSKNWTENLATDFSDDTFSNTEVSTSTGDMDGAVILKATPGTAQPAWECITTNPNLYYDLPGNTNATAIVASGNNAFIGQGNTIHAFQISASTTPVELDNINLSGTIRSFFISGNYLYAMTNGNQTELEIINISNPANLIETGFYNTASTANGRGVYVAGNRAYVVTENYSKKNNPEFYIVNITNPASPTLVGQYDVGANATGVRVSGNYAYLSTNNTNKEFLVLNISNENNITQAGSIDLPNGYGLTDIRLSGNYAYVTTGSNWGRFYSINISNPNSPAIASYLDYPGINLNSLDVVGTYAFIASTDSSQAVIMINISNPNSLQFYKTLFNNTSINDVATNGNDIFIASSEDTKEFGYYISYQTSDWNCLAGTNGIDMAGTIDALKIITRQEGSKTIAYISRKPEGANTKLYAYDVTATSSVQLLGSYTLSNASINDFNIYGNYAYLATSDDNKEMEVVDISDKTNLHEAGSFNAAGTLNGLSLAVSGTRAYLGTENTFYILNVQNPASPALATTTSSYSVGYNVNSIKVFGANAYLAVNHANQELTILNIANEASITQTGTYATPAGSNGDSVFVLNNYVYLATADANILYILNVATSSVPTMIGSYDAGGKISDIYVNNDGHAFLATNKSGMEMQIVDVNNKANPVLINYYNNSGQAGNGVYQLGNFAYLANAKDTAEIQIAAIQNISGPTGNYPTSGYVISSPLDLGTSSPIEIIKWDQDIPACSPACSIALQLRTAPDVGGAPGAWTSWTGTSTVGTFFTNPSGELIPLSLNWNRWAEYKATLTGDGTRTPVLNKVVVEYK